MAALLSHDRAAGASHDSPRTSNVHISGPRRFKQHQNSTQGPQERGRRMQIVAGGGKKKREILGSPPFWAPPFWAPPFGAPLFLGLGPPPFRPHPSGLHPSGLHSSGPQPFGAPTLRGPNPSGPHPSGPHFFLVWASTLWGPPFEPTFCRPKIQHPKIGRSRNWPKSKLAELEKKKELAEVEIGRSRSPPMRTPLTWQ